MHLKELQKQVKDFIESNNMNTSVEFRTLDLVSEVGELSKEIIKSSNYGKVPVVNTENMCSEFGDVIFSLIAAANAMEINLEKELNSALVKYSRRLKKGGAGSENE